MPLADTFDPQDVAQSVTGDFYQRMVDNATAWVLTDDLIQTMANLLFEMAKISGGLFLDDPTLATAGEGSPTFDINDAMALQGVKLFGEGVFHAQLKAHAMGLPVDVGTQLVQSLAQDLFQQAKQVMASTYGQEDTPELQFSWEQQASWMQQSADNGFIFYLNEYEKEHGPIQASPIAGMQMVPEPQPPDVSDPVAVTVDETPAVAVDMLADPSPEAPVLATIINDPAPQPLPAEVKPQAVAINTQGLPLSAEKYAAMALFIAFLPPNKATLANDLFSQLSTTEQAVVKQFCQLGSLEGIGLNLAQVESAITQLQQQLTQHLHRHQQQVAQRQALQQTLTQLTPGERAYLLRAERPALKSLVGQLALPLQGSQASNSQWQHILNPETDVTRWRTPPKQVPPAIQGILTQYLSDGAGKA
jgi:hypothetical protein